MNKKENRNPRLENGQSMVELAVSLIILLVLLAGIIDFGRLAFHYIAMRDAAQEGASYGIINPTDCYQIENRIRAGLVDEAAFLSDGTARFEISIVVIPKNINEDDEDEENPFQKCSNSTGYTNYACEGNTMRITIIDKGFPITMPLFGTFFGQSLRLETIIRDTIIRPQC